MSHKCSKNFGLLKKFCNTLYGSVYVFEDLDLWLPVVTCLVKCALFILVPVLWLDLPL